MSRAYTRTTILPLVLLLGLGAALSSRAAPDAPPSPAAAPFVRAVELFDRARSGDKSAVEAAR